MAWPQIKSGQINAAVLALKSATHRYLDDRNMEPLSDRSNRVYGRGLIIDVQNLKYLASIDPVNGTVAGSRVWELLDRWGYITLKEKQWLSLYWTSRRIQKEKARKDAMRGDIVEALVWAFLHRSQFHYRQYRPMAHSLKAVEARNRTDCSAYATLGFKDGGAPDPNHVGYNGTGYTGTLIQHGVWIPVQKSLPADLAFYGPNQQAPTHVAIRDENMGNPGVYSFGHTPIEHYTRVAYRDDFLGCFRPDVL